MTSTVTDNNSPDPLTLIEKACESMPVHDDRRTWIRTASEFSHLRARCNDSFTLMCPVLDESVGGLCLAVHDATMFEVGKEVELIYATMPMIATVCYCEERTDGRYRVGLQWQD